MMLRPFLKMVVLSEKAFAQSAVLDSDQAPILASSTDGKTPPVLKTLQFLIQLTSLKQVKVDTKFCERS